MWVFGYGSLMWDGWEIQYRCCRRVLGKLQGFKRVFNKSSVKNWGTRTMPCPTLNLVPSPDSHCYGYAFEFSEERKHEVISYLTKREGDGFKFCPVSVEIEGNVVLSAIAPFYQGKNLISDTTISGVVTLAIGAKGTQGSCLEYIKSLNQKLIELGINDPAITEIVNEIESR